MRVPEVLATGGTGVLGRRVVERLRSAGVEARVLSRSGRSGTVRGICSRGRDWTGPHTAPAR